MKYYTNLDFEAIFYNGINTIWIWKEDNKEDGDLVVLMKENFKPIRVTSVDGSELVYIDDIIKVEGFNRE